MYAYLIFVIHLWIVDLFEANSLLISAARAALACRLTRACSTYCWYATSPKVARIDSASGVEQKKSKKEVSSVRLMESARDPIVGRT